jgi:MEMO1 family protein
MLRQAVHAGRFYPAGAAECRKVLKHLLESYTPVPGACGGIVPHAGWVYSGAAAAKVWASLALWRPEIVVIFGAVHSLDSNRASIWTDGAWDTPLGPLSVARDLAHDLIAEELIVASHAAHQREHAIEVQLPFVKALIPDAQVVPISVRPTAEAIQVGQVVGERLGRDPRRIAVVGSTDLTHYGPAFGFEPRGAGPAGRDWARDVNDRRLVRLVIRLDAEAIVAEATEHHNACGGGAVAATVAVMKELGVRDYVELQHSTSAEVALSHDPNPENSVGYEAGVFLRPA